MSSQVTSTSASPGPRGSRWSWLLPALTFVAGCVLGAVVMGVGDVGGDDEPGTSAAATAAGAGSDETEDGASDDATNSTAGDATDAGDGDTGRSVRVPESCLQTADDAAALVEQVDRVVAAVADLDPERLRQTVDDVQQVRDEVQDVATQCRDAAADGPQDADTQADAEPDDEGAAPATPSS